MLFYGWVLNFCREYDKAEEMFLRVIENDPYNSIAISNIKSTYHVMEEYEKALEYWRIDHRNDTSALSAIDRGYEKIEEKFKLLGADIRRENG